MKYCCVWRKERDYLIENGVNKLNWVSHVANQRSSYVGRDSHLKVDTHICQTLLATTLEELLARPLKSARADLQSDTKRKGAADYIVRQLTYLGHYKPAADELAKFLASGVFDERTLSTRRLRAVLSAATGDEGAARELWKVYQQSNTSDLGNARVGALIDAHLGTEDRGLSILNEIADRKSVV